MVRVYVLFMFVFIIISSSCVHNNKKAALENKPVVNIDSLKRSVHEKFNATLATLDSAMGASENTAADSIHIALLRDSIARLSTLLDSMGVSEY